MLIEPDAEVVQSHPRRQSCSQARQLVRPLPVQAEGVNQLLGRGLHDLADAGYPTPQAFRLCFASSVAFGRADEPCPIALEPAPVVICPLKTLVEHIGCRGDRACGPESGGSVGLSARRRFRPFVDIGGGGGPETEACL